MKNYKGSTLNKIKLMEDINLGDYNLLISLPYNIIIHYNLQFVNSFLKVF